MSFSAVSFNDPKPLFTIYAGRRPVLVTDYDLDCMITTAFEGGIQEWAGRIRTVHPSIDKKPRGVPQSTWAAAALLTDGVVFIDDDDDGCQPNTMLTLSMCRRGFQEFIRLRTEQKELDGYIDYNGRIEMAMVDAGDASGMLQFALWGEWVYA
ncbi:hypothetical protein ACP26L_35930 (plasmid) [Paenibacillus sp. S-38]|uniref:hypothetical protein n=1 Tax=Paenibacillus sp. S-38 TaxID=3416710 RepID=UPI003CE91A11